MGAQHACPGADDSALSDIRLRCPRCGTDIDRLDCPACWFSIVIDDGIAHALPPESIAQHARFMADYERIRQSEGRGSESADFYLGLPYRDTSGRNREQWQMRARSYDYLVRHLLDGTDRDGRILDLGAGNGWMSYRLALAGYRPCAVDLLTNDQDGLGAARHYRTRLPKLFPRFQAEIRRLPFADEQFDAAVFNASFHYAENYEASLRETLRCVKVGGVVIISDTPWYAREESGRQMLAERRAAFLQSHGIAADSIATLGYLTDERLHRMEDALSIHWDVRRPWYGLTWAVRPLVATLRGKREPSKFRLYVARKGA
ncbi:class I SAM-dependent methyltransferase [Rhodanobacter panaciterrae]|uniref:class I SAM-dependent methyltransferase n=1 Tax=Rhodanobacter panaciterrae TaxID=490572 RepID=UPI001673F1E9|nr:class I SAM-dependent methyltransferase [Rhodanobacter panaciterrae]